MNSRRSFRPHSTSRALVAILLGLLATASGWLGRPLAAAGPVSVPGAPVTRPAALPATIKVGTEGVYPPFSYHVGSKLTGYDVDYITEVGKRIGVKIQFVETPWDSMFAALDSGRIDLVANQVTKNPERTARYTLSRPYVTTTGVVVVRDNDNSVKKLSDLKGKTSAQNITSSWAAVAKRGGANVVAVDSMDKGAELLSQGRVDALVNDELAVRNFLSTHPTSGLKIALTTDDKAESVFAAKGDKPLMTAVDGAIKAMEADGTSKKFYDKYFSVAAAAPSTWQVIKANLGPMLLAVLTATIPLALVSFAIGLALALALALARLSPQVWLWAPARFVISLVRGTPLLVQLFLIFYGLPQLGLKLSPWPAAIIAFSLNVAAYAAEIIRSAIQSVPTGQWEAAASLGMSRADRMTQVVLPQAARVATPPLANTLISLVKDTSLASGILVTEMFRRAQIAAAPSGAFLALYGVAALIYWVVCLALGAVQSRLEGRLGRHLAA